jgi:hypothetical protein
VLRISLLTRKVHKNKVGLENTVMAVDWIAIIKEELIMKLITLRCHDCPMLKNSSRIYHTHQMTPKADCIARVALLLTILLYK